MSYVLTIKKWRRLILHAFETHARVASPQNPMLLLNFPTDIVPLFIKNCCLLLCPSTANINSDTEKDVVRLEGNLLFGSMPETVCANKEEDDDFITLSVDCDKLSCGCCTPECEWTGRPTARLTPEPTITETVPPTKQPMIAPMAPTKYPVLTLDPTRTAETDAPTDEPTVSPIVKPTGTDDPPSLAPTAMPMSPDPSSDPTEASTEPSSEPLPTPAPSTEVPTSPPTPESTRAPTGPCGISLAQRSVGIFENLKGITDEAVLFDPSSPQAIANGWLVNEDDRYLCPDDPTLLQRYILATLYFSADGDNWEECYRGANPENCGEFFPDATPYLSPSSECTWGYWGGGGKSCGSDGAIVSMQIPNNNLRGTLPPELRSLGFMETLSLELNSISGEIPPLPVGLSRVRLSNNEMVGPVGALPVNVSTLFLDGNAFLGTIDELVESVAPVVTQVRLGLIFLMPR